MTGPLRLAGAAGVAVALLVGLRVLSLAPYTVERDGGAVLRLAWRARGERIRECRELTPQELAKLPVHMREEEVCEGRLIPYRLVVALDSVRLVDRLIRGAGARQDRPLYVFQDFPVRPGVHRIVVDFTLQATGPGHEEQGEHHAGEHPEHELPRPPVTPQRLALDTTLELTSRRVLLVTYDEEREHLVVRNGSAQ